VIAHGKMMRWQVVCKSLDLGIDRDLGASQSREAALAKLQHLVTNTPVRDNRDCD